MDRFLSNHIIVSFVNLMNNENAIIFDSISHIWTNFQFIINFSRVSFVGNFSTKSLLSAQLSDKHIFQTNS